MSNTELQLTSILAARVALLRACGGRLQLNSTLEGQQVGRRSEEHFWRGGGERRHGRSVVLH